MPQSGRKKVLKIKFKRSDDEEKGSSQYGLVLPKTKGVNNLKSGIHSVGYSNKIKQPSNLFRKVFGNRLRKVRIVGGVPQKSALNSFLNKLLKSRNVNVNKISTRSASLLNQKVSSSSIVTNTLMQKEHAASRFLSIMMGKGKMIKNKVTAQLLGRQVWRNSEETKRLPHATKLQLFQALLNEPLPFLELHGRFGVSKQTIRRLVKNGLLMEEWGPKAIGVRFKLSKKGKIYLKDLEEAAKYESKAREKDFIRLKNKPLI